MTKWVYIRDTMMSLHMQGKDENIYMYWWDIYVWNEWGMRSEKIDRVLGWVPRTTYISPASLLHPHLFSSICCIFWNFYPLAWSRLNSCLPIRNERVCMPRYYMSFYAISILCVYEYIYICNFVCMCVSLPCWPRNYRWIHVAILHHNW